MVVVMEPGGKRVLVVDDNADAADALVALLRVFGHDAQAVQDPLRALPKVRAFDPALVILDVGMPGMDGYELARRIREQPPPGLRLLVALTGWGKEQDVARAIQAGFDRHVTKPITPETLTALLESL
ncbi:MAG TPA: response regulator [Solimonas sp.]|nr:response regulator [Solimonas sp.]